MERQSREVRRGEESGGQKAEVGEEKDLGGDRERSAGGVQMDICEREAAEHGVRTDSAEERAVWQRASEI